MPQHVSAECIVSERPGVPKWQTAFLGGDKAGFTWSKAHRWRGKAERFPVGSADYHFYHFSHRLPLQIATECNGLRRVAQDQNAGRIDPKPVSHKGFLGFLAGVG